MNIDLFTLILEGILGHFSEGLSRYSFGMLAAILKTNRDSSFGCLIKSENIDVYSKNMRYAVTDRCTAYAVQFMTV